MRVSRVKVEESVDCVSGAAHLWALCLNHSVITKNLTGVNSGGEESGPSCMHIIGK